MGDAARPCTGVAIAEAAELYVSLKVIRQDCTQRFTIYLRCRAASALAFDPSVRKLRHSGQFSNQNQCEAMLGNLCLDTQPSTVLTCPPSIRKNCRYELPPREFCCRHLMPCLACSPKETSPCQDDGSGHSRRDIDPAEEYK